MIDGSENAIVSWLLNFRIRMFVKSAVIFIRVVFYILHCIYHFRIAFSVDYCKVAQCAPDHFKVNSAIQVCGLLLLLLLLLSS